MRNILTEIGVTLQSTSPILWCDNVSAQSLASNPVHHAITKHIELDVHFIRDLVATNQLDILYVSTYHQPTDLFTKPLPFARFCTLWHKLTLHPSPIRLRGRVSDEDLQPSTLELHRRQTAATNCNMLTN